MQNGELPRIQQLSNEVKRVIAPAALVIGLGSLLMAPAAAEASAETHHGPATSEQSSPRCPQSGNYTYEQWWCTWDVTQVSPLGGTWRGKKQGCASYEQEPYEQHVGCSTANSVSHSVTATVGGIAEVSFGTLSASVGYTVNKTTTVTSSYTVDIPKNTEGGTVWWAGLFGDRKSVNQRYEDCHTASGRASDVSSSSSNTRKAHYPVFCRHLYEPQAMRTARTSQFLNLDYGVAAGKHF